MHKILLCPTPPVIRAVVEPMVEAARQEIAQRRAAAAAAGQAGQDQFEAGPALEALRRTVNARDAAGRTPLHLAAKRGHMDCIRCALVCALSTLYTCLRGAR